MFEDPYPVHWMGRQAVVALPEHIDVSNASEIREELLSVINRGAATLIADMTATLSCDQSGADAVMRAYQRALASGTQLRLAVTAQIVRRVFDAYGMLAADLGLPSLEAATRPGRPQPRRRPAGRSWRPLSSHPVPVRSPRPGDIDTVFDRDHSARPRAKRNGYVFHHTDNHAIESALSRALRLWSVQPRQFRELAAICVRRLLWARPGADYLDICQDIWHR